ncbi:MAG: adenylyltransferase/cytidyltransferase family protein [Oscillochloridaceae bacterium umkhey_bin13]
MSHTPLVDLVLLREGWRSQGRRLILTNGVFDLLHAGHVNYLNLARGMGDVLVVALNSDASTRALKGERRPLVSATDRATLLAGLRAVDYVTIFEERTAEAVVAALQPDYYVKGGDYGPGPDGVLDLTRLPEARVVHTYGGQVALVPFSEGRSTSALIALIAERYRAG